MANRKLEQIAKDDYFGEKILAEVEALGVVLVAEKWLTHEERGMPNRATWAREHAPDGATHFAVMPGERLTSRDECGYFGHTYSYPIKYYKRNDE